MRGHIGVIALVVALAASACASNAPDGSVTPSASPLSRSEALRPGIAITYPEEGADPLPAGEIIVAVTVRSFDVVEKLGEEPKDGQGHVHYYIDVEDVPTKPGKPAVTKDRRTYHAAAQTSHRWQNVRAGVHTFAVQLVNNDHTPLDPPVVDEVEIRVAG